MFVLVAQLLAGADTLSARAESLLAQGKLPEARRVAEQLVARSPRDPQAHLLLGRVWMRSPLCCSSVELPPSPPSWCAPKLSSSCGTLPPDRRGTTPPWCTRTTTRATPSGANSG